MTPENITWEGIAANAEKSEEITVTLSNIEAVMAELSGDNPTAFSINKNYLEASGKIIVSKNTTTIGNYAATLTISDAETQTKTIALSMEVVADPEPTGTFEKFTGTIEEGDYVLVANGTTDALKNTITSNRFDCGTVEVADNKIVNPDKSVIWHIAANDAYWTMYNESTTSYAGGTTSRNQGALLDAVTDLAKWTITVDDKGVYTFENYGRSQQKSDYGNKFLSKNSSASYWATYASGQKNPVLYKKHVDVAVEKPTISGETSFLTSTTVTLDCSTDGATIYYTTDESDPKTSETKQIYSDAFNLTETTKVRAIANKGDDWSEEATSKTFTKIEPDYTTIAAFLTAQPSTDKYIQFAGNVVVTGVNGKNVFIQDESGNAICLYFAANSTWTKGHKVTGMFQAKYATYGNMPEMSIADGNEGTIAATETAALPDPTEITSLEEATINANMCKYVVLKGVYFQGQSLTNKTVNLQDASSNVLKFYDNLSLTEGKALPLTATACDVSGILISYKSGKDNINEILPVDVACINAGAAALPTLSTAGSTDEEHPTMVANGESITITPAAGFTSTLNAASLNEATNISITETESNTVIAVSASRDYYATANATYYFKANPAGTKYAITVVQPEQGGTLEANFAETEAGNIVTLTATPTNSHFAFDGWVVKKTDEPEASPETVTENQFSMPEYDVTVTGSFTEEAKATLTFAKGEATGTEDAPENIVNYAGEVTLPACPFTYSGHYFIGWKKGETEDIYQPGAYTITAADVAAGTIAFTAQWAAGSIFEWVADGHGYTNQEAISLVNSTPIAIKFAQGESSNAPKYFTSDQTARFYTDGTLTITAPTDYVISKIEFSTTEWGVTANKGTLDGNTWTGLAEEVIFTATVTCKVKSLKVYYKEGAASTLEIDDIEMAYGDVVTISPKTVTPVEAASHVGYQIKAGSDDCITLAGNQITAKSVTGTATIVATIPDAEGGEYLGTSVEFTVRVSAPDSRYKAEITSLTSTSGTIVTVKEGTHKDKEYISYAAYKGDGTTSPAADGVLKIYKPSTGKSTGGYVVISAVKGCIIDEVQVTNADSKATTIGCSTTSTLATTGTAYAKAATVAFTNLNSSIVYIDNIGSERADITKITVYYTGEPLAIDHYFLGGTYETTFEQNGTFDYTGLKVYAAYDASETITEPVEGFTVEADLSTAGEKKAEVYLNEVKIAEYNITVTAGKEDPALAYSPVSETITAGDAWSAPTLSNTFNVTPITYSSDKESVATVTSEGVITLAGGYGTAVITAHFDESAAYIESEATYTITVNKPAATPTSTVYRKVTATADITDGEYLIVYEGDAKHEAAVFDGSLDNVDQAKKTLAVEIVNDEIAGNTDLDAATFTIDVTTGTLKSASGWYIGRTDNSNGLDKSKSEAYVNTFAITDDVAVITGVGNCTLRYNYASDQLRFRYYTSGQQAIQLYKKVTPPTLVRTGLTPGNYYTICYPKAMKNIQGATLWSFIGKDTEFAYLVEETATTIDAGKPYILYATASTVQAEVEGEDAVAAGKNGAIHGTFSLMNQDALNAAATDAGHDLYLVIGNQLRQATGDALTFGNSLPANRAYVILDEITGGKPASAPGRNVRSMPMHKNTATGMDELNTSEAPRKMIIDGKMYIFRGEKMYNANGQLVK